MLFSYHTVFLVCTITMISLPNFCPEISVSDGGIRVLSIMMPLAHIAMTGKLCRCSFWFFLVSRTKIFLSLLRDKCKIWLSLLSYFPLIRINLHHCEHGCWEISCCVPSIPQTLLQLEHQHLPDTHRSLLLPLQSSKVLWIPDWFCSIFWWEFILLYTNSNWNEVKPLKILLLFIEHVPPAFKVIVKQC